MKMKAGVLGLGQVGLPTALYMADRGIDVWGYDISEKAVRKGRNSGINTTTHWNEIPQIDIYVVCVSTSVIKNDPDLTAMFDVCEKINQKGDSSSLVSIESTVVPGTCRKIFESIFRNSISLIHVPHRFWPDDPKKHGVKQDRVIGAVDSKSLEKGLDFYRDFLGIPLHIAPSVEIAEMSKIAENAYRYVQIAFAEELSMICRQSGLVFKDVRKACNTKWNIEIPEARAGIKGHCLPKDIRYLSSISENNALMKSAILVDNKYQQWLKSKKQPARPVVAPELSKN
jgi:nucleotide sugar dehydrogenase